MSAQPKRKPEPAPEIEPAAPAAETPRLRSRRAPRMATAADAPADGEVVRLQRRAAAAFAPRPATRLFDIVLKVLVAACGTICVGQALLRAAPSLSHLTG